MNIPSVKIGPMRYPISEVDDLHDFDGDKRIDLWGHIKHSNTQIELRSSLSDQRKLQVLWHEILHGILSDAGYGEHNEQHLDALATGLIQLLRDNPQLVNETIHSTEDRAEQLEQLRAGLRQLNGNKN